MALGAFLAGLLLALIGPWLPWRPPSEGSGFERLRAVLASVQALYDAADDDSATGGPDLSRRIFPVIATVTADGFRKLSEAESEAIGEQVVRERMAQPDGPPAPLRAS